MISRILLITLSALILQSCSTKHIELDDIHGIDDNTQKLNEVISSKKHLYQVAYEVNNSKYTYSTFEINNKYKYLQITTKDNILFSISPISLRDAHWPEIRNCTLFPSHKEVESQICLLNFSNKIESLNNEKWKSDVISTNKQLKKKLKDDKTGSILMAGTVAILTAPIILPTAAIATPLAATADSYSKSEENLFNIKLGETISDETISAIDPKYVSLTNKSGTIFIYGNIFFGEKNLCFWHI